jgi:predicted transcriptional regulator YdeE
MLMKELPASKYIVFCFRGKTKDSLQPIVDYIYKEWFPQSTCQFNSHAKYDFAKYGEAADKDGHSDIEYWVPIV